jgi:hypothetical protein
MAPELSISIADIESVFSIKYISDYDQTTLDFLANTISYAKGSISGADTEESRKSAAKQEIGSQAEDGKPGLQLQTLFPAFRYFVGDPEPYNGDPSTDLGSKDKMKRTRAALEELSQKSKNVEEAIRLTKHELDKLTIACMAAGVGFTEQDSYYPWDSKIYRAFCILWHRYKLARPQEFSAVARIDDALSGVTLGLSET